MISIVYSEHAGAKDLAAALAACLSYALTDVAQHPLADVAHLTDDVGGRDDLVVTIGGDGTLLRAAAHCPPNVPLLGVNMGNLGYLTGSRARTVDSALAHVNRAMHGEVRPQERMRLRATVSMGLRVEHHVVLNDVVLDAARTSLVTFRVFADEREVTEYRSDGLIIATPTGSTAYNLSAGGPILMPSVRAIVIAAICPHNLNNRPIVLDPGTRLRVVLSANNRAEGARLSFDGAVTGFPHGAVLDVEVGPPALLYHYVDPFEVLRARLGWS